MPPAQRPLDPQARLRQALQLAVCGVLFLSLIVVAVLWGPAFWQIVTDQERFRMWLESYGAYAALLFVATQFIQVVIFFLPGEVTQFVGGYLFGTWLGLALSYLGIAYMLRDSIERIRKQYLVTKAEKKRMEL